MRGELRDLTNQKQVRGYLTAIEHVGFDTNRHALWMCLCSLCGGETVVRRGNFLAEKTTISCGCLKAAVDKNRFAERNPHFKDGRHCQGDVFGEANA